MRVLIVEDEKILAENLKLGLEDEKFAVDMLHDGLEAYERLSEENYDLVVLDLMIPGMDGLSLCKKLRSENNKTPILMLTAKDGVENKIEGLNSGADDYLPKPFAFAEVLARIHALIRRSHQQNPIIKRGKITMQPQTHQVTLDEKALDLTGKEYQLLEYLLNHQEAVVTREQIQDHVWDYNAELMSNTIEVIINRLRKKGIDIKTIRGLGYQLK